MRKTKRKTKKEKQLEKELQAMFTRLKTSKRGFDVCINEFDVCINEFGVNYGNCNKESV